MDGDVEDAGEFKVAAVETETEAVEEEAQTKDGEGSRQQWMIR